MNTLYQGTRKLRVQRTGDMGHGYECRLYIQRGKIIGKGNTQLVGFASAISPEQAMHKASIAALENLFEDDLKAA